MFNTKTFVAALVATVASAQLTIEDRIFKDEDGRQIIMHGVNAIYKTDPYIPTTTGDLTPDDSMNAEDIQNLVDWGFNFVRLGVMWEAVERSPGVYDDEYLAKVTDLVNSLGEAGIYTLVDAHQDVLARIMCGEGMPDFYAKDVMATNPSCINSAVDAMLGETWFWDHQMCFDMDDYGFGKDENDDYVIADCQTVNFGEFYNSKQSWSVFRALYNNQLGLQDKFVAYWDHTSAHFAGNKYVVGYDPLNEPAQGNLFKNPLQNISGWMDEHQLTPMYARVHEKYMANTNGTAISWFEPGFEDISGYVHNVGFKTPPGGEIGSTNHVLNDHTYCCQLGYTCPDGDPDVQYEAECLTWHQQRIYTRAEDAKRLGVPFFNTEFGACLTEDNCTMEIRLATEVTDDVLSGWAYWQFKTYEDLTTSAGDGAEGFYNKDGTLATWKVKALARTYLMRTQGMLSFVHFDMETTDFDADFWVNTDLDVPSIMYYSAEHYYGTEDPVFSITNNGVTLDSSQFTSSFESGRYIHFQVTDTSLNQTKVRVHLTSATELASLLQ